MEKGRHKSKIFLKIYGSFAVLVLLFALLLGFIFVRLYTNSNQQYNLSQLNREAAAVAEHLRNCIIDKEYDEAVDYLAMLNELQTIEVYSFSNPNAAVPMSKALENTDYASFEQQQEFKKLIDAAFKGESTHSSFYSGMHGATTAALAAPVIGKNREVCGAILLVSNLEQMDSTVSSAKYLVFVSASIALIISFVVATGLVRKITEPISQMQRIAREMTEGNYRVKTGIDRTDEIGEMARSIDRLSEKLLENEEERRNMEQMRLDFFANVSHELRTPISVVRAYTESLVDGVVTDASKVEEYYSRMLRECKSMERLVGDLLTLSKMQNPNFKVEKEPVNVVHIIDELVRSAIAISVEKSISVQLRRDSDVCMIMGDYDRLRQMFMVIFDNAIKFSPVGSTIHVTIRKGDMLAVSIRDEGIGISDEELPNIFDKFYKSKLRQNAKGTGLGLAIAKYICLKHDGKIEVRSKVGEGTEFIFYFREVHEEELANMS